MLSDYTMERVNIACMIVSVVLVLMFCGALLARPYIQDYYDNTDYDLSLADKFYEKQHNYDRLVEADVEDDPWYEDEVDDYYEEEKKREYYWGRYDLPTRKFFEWEERQEERYQSRKFAKPKVEEVVQPIIVNVYNNVTSK